MTTEWTNATAPMSVASSHTLLTQIAIPSWNKENAKSGSDVSILLWFVSQQEFERRLRWSGVIL